YTVPELLLRISALRRVSLARITITLCNKGYTVPELLLRISALRRVSLARITMYNQWAVQDTIDENANDANPNANDVRSDVEFLHKNLQHNPAADLKFCTNQWVAAEIKYMPLNNGYFWLNLKDRENSVTRHFLSVRKWFCIVLIMYN
ncbi:hypothetical protein TSAR_017047, partial [Trichomalopsis sarcophagae]